MTSETPAIVATNLPTAPPSVDVPEPTDDAPVDRISSDALRQLGAKLTAQFDQHRSDRRIWELKLLRDQRQYLGIYDWDLEKEMSNNRSKAYPRITRVKCLTVRAQLMHLMYPGNERNWELDPAPDPDISVEDVQEAIQAQQKRDQDAGVQSEVTPDYAMDAVHQMMLDRAEKLSVVIDDQLQELGGDQTLDYIALDRAVLTSGIIYGLGLLRGPFARQCKSVVWEMDDQQGIPMPKTKKVYKPFFEFVPVWDFYPDLSAKTFSAMNGYFIRKVMSRSGLKALCNRPDFMCDQIEAYLKAHPTGNYIPLEFEQELRIMGIKANVNEQKPDSQKYQILVWVGKIDGRTLQLVGETVSEDRITDELDAEVWMIDGNVIRCKIDPWKKLGYDVKMLHPFLFDEDDTSPVGASLCSAMRDSQMMVAAATRMLLDNASVTCGPNLEVNTKLLRADQDLTSLRAYRMWYREDEDPSTVNSPSVRNVQIDSHMEELLKIIDLGMKFADAETFVGPANGADQSEMPSEPFRTASGASMLRGNAALPFKDVVRSFDSFIQSKLQSMVAFNQLLNPNKAHKGDYNVIARGATSLIAKEVRGMQADQLTATLTPEEKVHIDGRKLLAQRLKSRDMEDIMVSESEAARRQAVMDQEQQKQQDQQDKLAEATVRKTLSDGYKNIASGQQHLSDADAQTLESFFQILERGLAINGQATQQPAAPGGGAAGSPVPGQSAPGPDDGAVPGAAPDQVGGGQEQPPFGQPGQSPGLAGQG